MLHHASGMSYIRSIMNDCHREWEPPESASLPSSHFEIARHRRTLHCDWSHEFDRDSRMNTSAHTIAIILERNRLQTGARIGGIIGANLVKKMG